MYSHPIDIIILTECRINNSKPLPLRPNYTTHSTTTKTNQNDGVVAIVNNSIAHSVREAALYGASCLEITLPNYKIVCIYRSPSEKDASKFIHSLDTYLSLPHMKTNVILTGDINIDIKVDNKDKYCDQYLDMLASHNLLPGHRLNTRINSCLDHIICNIDSTKVDATVAVIDTSITDHKTVLLSIYDKFYSFKPQRTKTVTNYTEALLTLQTHNVADLLNLQDPKILCSSLLNLITNCLDKHTKIIKIPSNKRIIKPWITPGILKCIKNRNRLQKQLSHDATNDILKITYRRYRNYCNNLIKKLKTQYERDLLEKAKANNKTLWSTIKTITNLNKQKNKNTELITIKTNSSQSAEYVNNHFNNIGEDLANKIIQNSVHNKVYFSSLPSLPNSIGIVLSEVSEIEAIITNLKSDSAAGKDGIPTNFIKMAKNELAPIITHLSSLCFQQGVFPPQLKQSIIHPIFKSGDRGDINNYRPISVLKKI
ncbi:hypothetical protein ABMA28_016590 [Loxostege sticticalis]|uniref:Tick transposon n=1 Tax=Loxostege sticticalis TaxID=481309 RepID=A0ABD0T524_LOXSC